MIQDFLVPFITVGLAELGDKTQLTIFCLASKTKKYIQLLLGAVLAFLIADGIAILLGDVISKFIPLNYVKIFAGIIFIVFGIITLLKKEEQGEKCDIKNPFLSSFGLIFISELGDKTQIAAALFATKYNPFLVLAGVILAMAILSIISIYLGNFIFKKINKKTVSLIAGILFIIIGMASFF